MRAPGVGFEQKIRWVEYAVNPALEVAYEEKKMEMTRRLGSAGVNERLLFHGTSFANSEAILRENFRLDKVGTGQLRVMSQHLLYASSPSVSMSSYWYARFKQAAQGAGRKHGASLYTRSRPSHSLSTGVRTEAWCPFNTQRCHSSRQLTPLHPAHSEVGVVDRMKCVCVPYPRVGSATDGGWFGRGFYFSKSCEKSLACVKRCPRGGGLLLVKVLVGGVNTFHHALCYIDPPRL